MEAQIPIIDMQERNVSSKVIREACEKWGCFRVINHGVPTKLMAEIKAVTSDLFDLTVEIKQNNKTTIPGSGYVAPSQHNPVYEALSLDIISPLSLPSFLDSLQATPIQREIIEKYTEGIQNLGSNIVNTMLLDDNNNNTKVWLTHMRMNKYDITLDRVGNDGLPMHMDGSLITILHDDENLGGLEIINPNGDKVPVDCLPGSLFVFLGEIAVPWSNGKFKGVLHRVECKDVGKRLTIASIITPKIDEDMKVHPKFIEDGHPPKYMPFKFEEFRVLRAAKSFYRGEILDHYLTKN